MLAKSDLATVGRLPGVERFFGLIICADLELAMSRFHNEYKELRNARHLKAYPFTAIGGGVAWKQEILDPNVNKEALVLPTENKRALQHKLSALDKRVFSVLTRDARIPLRELAKQVEAPLHLVQRSKDFLINSQVIVFRCDVARRKFDYKFSLVVILRTSPESANELVRRMGKWAESRFCAEVFNKDNVVAIFGIRDTPLITSLLTRIEREAPAAEIVSYEIAYRMEKVYGWLLDPNGHQVGHVPLELA